MKNRILGVILVGMFFTGCSTVKGLSDSLTTFPNSTRSDAGLHKIASQIKGMNPEEVIAKLGIPSDQGIAYFRTQKSGDKSYKDFILFYPINPKSEVVGTTPRALYNMEKNPFCLMLIFKHEQKYRFPERGYQYNNMGTYSGNGPTGCNPNLWRKDFEYQNLTAKKFSELTGR